MGPLRFPDEICAPQGSRPCRRPGVAGEAKSSANVGSRDRAGARHAHCPRVSRILRDKTLWGGKWTFSAEDQDGGESIHGGKRAAGSGRFKLAKKSAEVVRLRTAQVLPRLASHERSRRPSTAAPSAPPTVPIKMNIRHPNMSRTIIKSAKPVGPAQKIQCRLGIRIGSSANARSAVRRQA